MYRGLFAIGDQLLGHRRDGLNGVITTVSARFESSSFLGWVARHLVGMLVIVSESVLVIRIRLETVISVRRDGWETLSTVARVVT